MTFAQKKEIKTHSRNAIDSDGLNDFASPLAETGHNLDGGLVAGTCNARESELPTYCVIHSKY